MKSRSLHRNLSPTTAMVGFALVFAVNALGVSWNQYRGPTHDGISAENLRFNWTEKAPKLLWRVPLGPAFSSISVSDNRVFTQVRRTINGTDREICVALRASDGQELWAVDVGIADYPDGGADNDDGPRSTPSVDGDRVYVLSSYLNLVCIEAATGKVIYEKDFLSLFGGGVASWQSAASPLIVGDLIYIHTQGANKCLAAIRKADGSVAWSGQGDRMTQASPIFATIHQVPQVIYFAKTGLVSVKPDNGQVLWRFAFPFSVSTGASPVVANDIVYCSAAYGIGAGAARIASSGNSLSATQLWRKANSLPNHWATPVHFEGHIYGIFGSSSTRLRCIEAATGTEKWNQSGVGRGGLLLVKDQLVILTEDGDLVVAKADSTGYQETARIASAVGSSGGYRVKCWNVPAISDGRIYVRSSSEMAVYDVSTEAVVVPIPPLRMSATFVSGAVQLSVRHAEGGGLDPSLANRLRLQSSAQMDQWTDTTDPIVASDGILTVSTPISATQKFYRITKKPE